MYTLAMWVIAVVLGMAGVVLTFRLMDRFNWIVVEHQDGDTYTYRFPLVPPIGVFLLIVGIFLYLT